MLFCFIELLFAFRGLLLHSITYLFAAGFAA